MSTTAEPRELTRDELIAMFRAMSDVRSVELKLTVPSEQRAALTTLDLDLLDGRIREVYFFDTPTLDLYQHGVVVRARRTQGATDDTVVKLRPAQLNDLPRKVQTSPNLKVEMDITKGSYVVSASLKAQRGPDMVHAATARDLRLAKLFSKEQRDFFTDHAPPEVGFEDLVTLGPAYVVVLKHMPRDVPRKLTIEQWHFPGQVPLVELSTKCTPSDVLTVVSETTALLERHGLSATGNQETKTRKALEFFATPSTG